MKRRWFLSALLCVVLIGSMFSTSVFALEDIPIEPVSTEAGSVPTEEPLTDDPEPPVEPEEPDDTPATGDGSMPWMWAALMLTSLLTAVRLRKAR